MSDLKSRGNEIISATLIEIMLVLVFVLLIVIVFNQQADDQDQGSLEKLCPEFRQVVESLNMRSLAAQVDCSTVKDDPKAALAIWLEILSKVIEAGGISIPELPRGGVTGDGVHADLKWAMRKIATLEAELDQLRQEKILDRKEILKLEKLLAEFKEAFKDGGEDTKELIAKISELIEDLAEAERRLTEANQTIVRQKARIMELEKAKGVGTAPGPCMFTRRDNGTLSPDYLLKVDYTGDNPLVSLRADGRHENEIAALIKQKLIPQRLTVQSSVEYTKELFQKDFKALLKYSKVQEPICRYQALLYLDRQELSYKSADKEFLIREYFHADKGFR